MTARRQFADLALLLALAAPALAQRTVTTRTGDAPLSQTSYSLPPNFYGAHLLVDSGTGKGEKHLRWARYLCGRWGYAKTLLGDIDRNTPGPAKGWIDYVNTCYRLELIPLLRLGGHMQGGTWVKPEADAPGDYHSMAAAIRRVVQALPRSAKCPLYIELWNEPNLNLEWSGHADPAEYAPFFVQAARAIHDIGDPRIKVLNGGLATSPDWAEKLCQIEPDFMRSFDFWACHPYPANRPPSVNHHDHTAAPAEGMVIDGYTLELDVLKRLGAPKVRVMITETGYDLGNSVYTRSENYPIIDEYNRADYMVRAFRDYYPKWKEIAAVFPFEFCSDGWERFNWVHPDSGTNEDGSPTRPHYQYTAVAALAKPTDTTGAISGTITVRGLDARLDQVAILSAPGRTISDPMGNYFLPKLKPGSYHLDLRKVGFKDVNKDLTVTAATNTVFDVQMEPDRREKLTGKVKSGDDNRPLANARVTLQPGAQTAKTDTTGQYTIHDVIPARYRLIAEAPGRYNYEAGDVSILTGRNNNWDFALGNMIERLTGENMINNPSMEAGGGGAAKPGLALGFEPYNDQGGRNTNTAIAETTAHTGRRSQEMKVRPDEIIVRQITHYNTATPGQRYKAGVWIRTDIPDGDGAAWMTFDFTDNGGGLVKRLDPKQQVKGRSRTWQWVDVDGEAPQGAQRLSINFHTKGRSGAAYFDDAYVGQVPGTK